jgi:hypothetical protein
MVERRTRERRKHARAYRVDVKRGEFDQLRALVLRLAEQVVRLARDIDDLHRKLRY